MGFFKRLTNWMQDLANPSKNIEDSMMVMMSSMVQWLVSSIIGVFKPFLGAGADVEIETFSKSAAQVFTRFTQPGKPSEPRKFMPSFEHVR